ncbi:MAG TPA: hypothetical protein VKA46_03025 [Gemmataceae bacterium]|nr:hypothetical protein [Gemmataceae bacterium]
MALSDATYPGSPSPPAARTGAVHGLSSPEVCVADRAAAAGKTSWLWDGYLAHGNVTLLTSQWKSGKNTPLSIPLVRRETGG